jgi:tRNA(Arg) A34 adenosine deaminase TadA
MAGNVKYFEGVVVTDNPRPPLTATGEELLKMLKIIENDIIPLTENGVATGSKMFGAAIMNPDYTCLHPDTNTESACPTFHAEVKCIVSWAEKTPAKDRGPVAQSTIFLATHEPCMMCISSILWGGWNKCWYFFGYENTAEQGIPHDINTMHELWGVNTYRKQNKYLSTSSIMEAIKVLPDSPIKTECIELQNKLIKEYDRLSNKYHTEKVNNADNSLVLG